MSEKIGPVAYHSSEEHPFLGREMSHEQREFSERTAALIDEEVMHILHAAGERARSMLEEHRDKLDMLTHALEEREMISHEEIEEMLGPSATQPTRAELDVETPSEVSTNGQSNLASPKPEAAN
jgi:cell division protease FtsH